MSPTNPDHQVVAIIQLAGVGLGFLAFLYSEICWWRMRRRERRFVEAWHAWMRLPYWCRGPRPTP